MLIILNGPPGCGKDTLANRLVRDHGFVTACFKHDLYQQTADYYGLAVDAVKARNENRLLKDLPFVNGLSVRQMLIHVSEDLCKPTRSAGFFGELACERIEQAAVGGSNIVFSDGGFIEEVQELKAFDPIVIRLHREGFTFDGDSRSYVYPPDIQSADVQLVSGEIDKGVADVLVAAEGIFLA